MSSSAAANEQGQENFQFILFKGIQDAGMLEAQTY
jgi:hypothetical protein